MKALAITAAFTTDKVAETRDFYVKYFNAHVTFDCGWYVNLAFSSKKAALQFMAPRETRHQLSSGVGLMYNFAVEDVDREYQRLTEAGLPVAVPLEDHAWGDRGFGVKDPNGVTLYVYSEREPGEEFKPYYT